MATHHSVPFAVRFHFWPGSPNSRTESLGNFTDEEAEADVDRVTLTEYWDCELEFASLTGDTPSDAKLYIDGLDALTHRSLVTEGGRTFIRCGTRIEIQNHEKTDFPWIPGSYRVQVDWNGTSYYTVLYVKPKNMDDGQLRLMREELEEYVVGLTLDLVRRNQGIGQSRLASKLPIRFYQYQLLEKHFAQLNGVFHDLLRRPKHEVRKVHEVLPANRGYEQDRMGYRWFHSFAGQSRNGGQTGTAARVVLAPQRIVDYDLPENRWTKKILLSFIEILDGIAEAVEASMQEDGWEAIREAERQIATVRRLQSRFRTVLSHPLFEQVNLVHGPLPYTPALRRDGRYRSLYQFWWNLVHHTELRVDASFEYQWKKTDLLWEYWSFVKTLQALQRMGFEAVSGWIYDERWRFPEQVFIPSIPAGTRVTMVRGTERIEVAYDAVLPHSPATAKAIGSVVYVEGRHDRPDVRVDYYHNEQYRYSVVVEAKYRKAHHIWNQAAGDQHSAWTQTMHQLRSYRTDIALAEDDMQRAVKNVVVLHPERGNLPSVHNTGQHISLVHLTPGSDDSHYAEYLEELLAE